MRLVKSDLEILSSWGKIEDAKSALTLSHETILQKKEAQTAMEMEIRDGRPSQR